MLPGNIEWLHLSENLTRKERVKYSRLANLLELSDSQLGLLCSHGRPLHLQATPGSILLPVWRSVLQEKTWHRPHQAGHIISSILQSRLPKTPVLVMSKHSSLYFYESGMIDFDNLSTLSRRSTVKLLRNRAPTASNTTCDTDIFLDSQPRLTLPHGPLGILVLFLVFLRLVLFGYVSQIWDSGCAEENVAGNGPERLANERLNTGTADGFGALDSLERGYNPFGPHGSKRKRDSDPEQPSKSTSRRKATRSFACPFYLRDRIRHSDCLNIRLKRLSDVRQHLLERAHYQVVHCPVCGVTFRGSIAEARRRRDAHIQDATCEPLPSPPNYPGITEDQERRIREIARNTRTNQFNQVQRWFEIWDFLFPGEERPDSPFLDDLPDIQRVVDWRNAIFGNNLWHNLPNEPWTTAMGPEEQRFGMLNFIESFLAQARALVGHDAGPREDDHEADNSTYIDANTPDPSDATVNRRVVSLPSIDSDHPADASRQAYLSPSSFTGSRQAPNAQAPGQMDSTTRDLPAVVASMPSRPRNESVADISRSTQQHTASESFGNLDDSYFTPDSNVEIDTSIVEALMSNNPSADDEK